MLTMFLGDGRRWQMDPELAEVAATLERSDLSDVAGARQKLSELVAAASSSEMPAGVEVRDLSIPRRHGGLLAARLYSPRQAGPLGCLVFAHGGAFVLGDLATEEGRCLRYAAEAGCAVLSVDYRLAPEHPFPAGLEDCYAALEWVADNGSDLSLDGSRLAVGGTSAGAGLAAAMALLARDRDGPRLVYQLLVYPVLDDRMATASMQEYTEIAPWDTTASRQMWELYLSGASPSPYAAPARAGSLAGLPAAYIMTAHFDPLRDEAHDYALRLISAGVPTEIHHFPGTFHGFDTVAPSARLSKRALEEQVAVLRQHVGTPVRQQASAQV
jgi:acetyl esterase